MNKFTLAMKRFGGFLKRNAFYLLIILCIASIATVIALAVTRNASEQTAETSINANTQEQQNDKPKDTETGGKEEPDPKPVELVDQGVTFIMPCNGTISRAYSDTMLVWSSTLKEYSTHLGTDFTSEDGNVFASADGLVKEVGTNALDGNYIVITHRDGYITKYMSLEEQPSLSVGAVVKQGEIIGKMATTQGTESKDGAHLHFEITKDGNPINPLEVFVLEEK